MGPTPENFFADPIARPARELSQRTLQFNRVTKLRQLGSMRRECRVRESRNDRLTAALDEKRQANSCPASSGKSWYFGKHKPCFATRDRRLHRPD